MKMKDLRFRIPPAALLRKLAVLTILVSNSSASFAQTTSPDFSISPAAVKTLVDSLANQVNKYYIEKPAALKISATLRKKLKEGAYYNIKDPHRLAGQLTADVLAVHKDEHFHIEYNPALANEVSGNIEDVPKMVAEKLQYDRNKNFGFKRAEVLPGNIGYLELSGFSRLNKYSKATADAALTLLSNSSALIIDVRYGVGGSPEMVNYILSHFFKDTTHIADIYIRSEKATIPYYTQPDSTYRALNQIPIYVLTSYKTFSAAEGLTYALKSLNRAVIVGETTRGGAHTVTYRPLSSGFVADIPFGHAIDPRTKTSWEGVGIIPNISVNADLAPETAEQLIFSKQLANCVDSTQAQSIRWQRDLLTSINHPLHLEANDLYAYTGTYGVYTITFDNEELYYQKLGKAKFPLIPMKQNQFRVKGNDSFMVVFQRDAMRVVCTIITYYDDGRTEIGHRQLK